MFVAVWLLPTSVSAADTGNDCALESVDQTNDRPQWQDIGMCDMLAVTGGSTVAPPVTVRVVHDSPSGTSVTPQTIQLRHNSAQRLTANIQRRPVNGYIYMIHCLRL